MSMSLATVAGTAATVCSTGTVRPSRRAVGLMLALAVAAGLAIAGPASAQDGATTERVSVAGDGSEGSDHSDQQSMSADGRFVTFTSLAEDLVEGDTNGVPDVFLRDRQEGTTERVSMRTDGQESSGSSLAADISGDGRYVVFQSGGNLTSNDDDNAIDIFIRDRQEGTTELVSVAQDGTTGNDGSEDPAVSDDGRFVAFESDATDLVPNDTNAHQDIFVRDLQEGTTERVSVTSDGSEASGGHSGTPKISADGQVVAFHSDADNLGPANTGVYVHDRTTGETELGSVSSNGDAASAALSPGLSPDGNVVAFATSDPLVAADTNDTVDVYVRERDSGTTERVSVASDGTQTQNLNDSHSKGTRSLSTHGRFVGFISESPNLVDGDTNGAIDTFVRDRDAGSTTRVSVANDGTEGNADSGSFTIRGGLGPSLSRDGQVAAFPSSADNLVETDTNGVDDVFARVSEAAAPASLALEPAQSTNTVGDEHTVTATVTDDAGDPVSGVTVEFEATGANSASGSQATDASGQASFSYTGENAGDDTISAFADADDSGTQEEGEPSGTAAKTWEEAAEASALTLTPQQATNQVGEDHTVTATVSDQNGDPMSGVTVEFEASGANSASGTGDTDASGEASFTYTGENAGDDTITAFADADGSGSQDQGEPSGTAAKTWEEAAAPPASLTLEPQQSTNTVGDEHTVTATVTDDAGDPVSGVTVEFEATGANSASGSQATDASGQASFSYTGQNAGDDTITAFADGDGSGTQEEGEPSGTAAKTWEEAAPEPAPEPEPAPADLSLEPAESTNPVGEDHEVTATVTDDAGDPVSGVTVEFEATGANTASGTAATDAQGEASFAYAGETAGDDTIDAFADADDSGTQDDGEPADTATKTWEPLEEEEEEAQAAAAQVAGSDGPASACAESFVPTAGFGDVAGSVHESAIDCVAWYAITLGVGDVDGDGQSDYAPSRQVTRDQMASFLARLAEEAGLETSDAPDAFGDDDGSVHEGNINALAALGVTEGKGDVDGDGVDDYAPREPVTRAQMASFLARLAEQAGLDVPGDAPDAFGDDDGSVHEGNINALAALGISQGKGDLDGDGVDDYAPSQAVNRAQMASFIARELGQLVEGGLAEPGGAEVDLADQATEAGELSGTVVANKPVAEVVADGCGLADQALDVAGDGSFTLSIPDDQPAGDCQLTVTVTTERPDVDTGGQTVPYTFDVTVSG